MRYLAIFLALLASNALALPKEQPLGQCQATIDANGFVPAVASARFINKGYDQHSGQPLETRILEGTFGYREPFNPDGTSRLRHLHDFVVTARNPVTGAATQTAHPYGIEHHVVLGGVSESAVVETEGRRFYATNFKGAAASNIPGFYVWSKRYGNEVYFAVGTVVGHKLGTQSYQWWSEVERTPVVNEHGFWRQVDVRSPMHMAFVLTKRQNAENPVCPEGGCVQHCAGGNFDIVPRSFGITAPTCLMATFQESELDRDAIYARYGILVRTLNESWDSHLSLNPGWPSVARCMNPIPGRNPGRVKK